MRQTAICCLSADDKRSGDEAIACTQSELQWHRIIAARASDLFVNDYLFHDDQLVTNVPHEAGFGSYNGQVASFRDGARCSGL